MKSVSNKSYVEVAVSVLAGSGVGLAVARPDTVVDVLSTILPMALLVFYIVAAIKVKRGLSKSELMLALAILAAVVVYNSVEQDYDKAAVYGLVIAVPIAVSVLAHKYMDRRK